MVHHSTGVAPVNFKDLAGQKFGRLTAIQRDGKNSRGCAYWSCICDCGKQSRVLGMYLANGHTVSCGCFRAEKTSLRRRKHGDSDSPEHIVWQSMIRRCEAPTDTAFDDYGGRGIYVCRRWRESYAAFLADMGRRPTSKHSIDRIDVNKSYTCGNCNHCHGTGQPANCRWATDLIQARNTRRNHLIIHNGVSRTLSEWSELSGISQHSIRDRLRRGWSVEDALSKPVRLASQVTDKSA